MDSVLSDFERRAAEVDAYFAFLRDVTSPKVVMRGEGLPAAGAPVSAEAQGVLKASTFLLLYNVVESSVRQALEAVYEEIRVGGYSFGDASDAIRTVWISRRYQALTSAAEASAHERIARQIVSDVLEKRSLDIKLVGNRLGGNIDADLIRQVADEHGISLSRSSDLRGGVDLSTVKLHRNNLAHGKFSFVDVGRDQSWSTLQTTKELVMRFTRRMLEDVREFIGTKQYLKRPPAAAKKRAPRGQTARHSPARPSAKKFRRGRGK